MSLPRVGVFHPGTQHSWQTARAFVKAGMLDWYLTSIFYQPQRWPYRLERYAPTMISRRMNQEFKRFYHPDLATEFVCSFGVYEWAFRLAARHGFQGIARKLNLMSNDYLAAKAGALLKSKPVDLLWGYDGCCLEAFAQARELGVRTVLDKTIGDPQAFNDTMSEVYREFPEFFLNANFQLSTTLIERQNHEYDLADKILVGSEFCRDTILSSRPDLSTKLQVVKYCFDDVFFPSSLCSADTGVNSPVRFIFIGQAGPRKGIHLLLQAFQQLERSAASLTILGQLQVPRDTFARFADRVQIVPTVRREEVGEFLRRADCLIFPSYFEGSAISIYEALAAGLGVIQSKNTGMELDNSVGWTLSKLDVAEIVKAMRTVIDSPNLLQSWKANARGYAEKFCFDNYAESVRSVALQLADKRSNDL